MCIILGALSRLHLDDAYRVTALANELRVANGYEPVGRKAGLANRQMWKEYGVSAPNWGYVYDRTLPIWPCRCRSHPTPSPRSSRKSCSASPLRPRPHGRCRAAVVHRMGRARLGSLFNGSSQFEFSLPTAAAAIPCTALAGRTAQQIGTGADEWLRTLRQFEVELYCDGKLMERGYGSKCSRVRYQPFVISWSCSRAIRIVRPSPPAKSHRPAR